MESRQGNKQGGSRYWRGWAALIAVAASSAVAPALAQEAAVGSSGGGGGVTLYGVVDAAIRYDSSNGASASGNPGQSTTGMIGGGMSESRWGIETAENLGGGTKVVANLEQRLRTQDGSVDGPQGNSGFHLAWVGIQNAQWGSLTLGRQWNVLFDLAATTFPSYSYSPYFDGFKPEMGFALGARSDDTVKYTYSNGPWRFGVQYGRAPTDSPTGGDTRGAYVRWGGAAGFAVGAGYMDYEFGSGKRVKAVTVGGSWTNGPWYLMTQYVQNKADSGLSLTDNAVLSALWTGGTSMYSNYGSPSFVATANKRAMWMLGGGYRLTPALRFDLYYYHVRQTGIANTHDTWNMWSAALDYAFSKRTDAYLEVDRVALSGNDGISMTSTTDDSPNGTRNRTGFSIGLRHRF